MKNRDVVTQSAGGIVTTGRGKVPVILVHEEDGHYEAIMAVNFLRAGCHEIQLVMKNGHESLLVTYQKMGDLMVALQTEEEKFWLFGKPKLEVGGYTVVIFKYHPSMKKNWGENKRLHTRT
jgi:hypothetical protein